MTTENLTTAAVHLPVGAELMQYRILELLCQNGESSIYHAEDQEGKSYWIREFLPLKMVCRDENSLDLVAKEEYQTLYKFSMAAFEELFQPLRVHDGQKLEYILPVVEQFYANNTVYMVQEALPMQDLRSYMAEKNAPLSWTEAKKRLLPLMNSVSQLHDKGVVHLGICPENLYVSEEGPLILCGFSTLEARTADGELDQELFDGFSAPEQYQGGEWKGGTWSDVYALGAVFYWLLCGEVPLSADKRLEEDSLIPAMEKNPSVPENVSDAISGALMLDPGLRSAVVDDFTSALLESVSGNTTVYEVPDLDVPNEHTVHLEAPEEAEELEEPKKKRFRWGHWFMTVLAFILGALAVGFLMYALVSDRIFENGQQEELPSEVEEQLYPVPDLVGHKYADIMANSDYKETFILNAVMEFSDRYPEGVIFEQSIAKDTMVEQFTTVVLTVSKGKEYTPLPNLVGFGITNAKIQLDDAGIAYTIYVVENKNYTPNTVFRTDPPADTKISAGDGTVVKIYVTPDKAAVEEKEDKDKSDKKDKDKKSSKEEKKD